MRWKSLCGGLALLLAFASGCKQQCFVTMDELNRVQTSAFNDLEHRPEQSCYQPLANVSGGPPPTMDDLDRKVRYISLQECIAIALEQGSTGAQNLLALLAPSLQSNPYLDPEVAFAGRGISTGGNDSIRVLALDPARAGAEIEGSLSKFDAVFFSSVTWNGNDTPIGTPIQTFQAGQSGLNAIESVNVTPSMSILKPMATGGVAGITFNVPYSYTNLPARVNPSYQPQLQFSFEQPLLQGFGVEINQLRNAHPGSILNPGVLNTQTTQEGILITRIRFDEQRAEFERLVNIMLVNTEFAYWNLYYAYWNLYAQEQALRHTYEVFKISRAGYEAGRTKAADYYQTRGQYEQFRSARLSAINQVLDSERQLRGMLGLPIDDGCRLVPSDEPVLAPYKPDWETAKQDALDHRPELIMARHEVKVAQFNLILAKNSLLPDLRFLSTYDFNSIGTRLDGPDSDNAFRNLSKGNFSNYSVGLRGIVPLGFRFANSNIRQAEVQLARAMEVVQDQELKVLRFLGQQYRLLSTQYELIKANRAQREAFGEQLKARYQEFVVGRSTLDPLLEAQRFWATALAAEYQSIALYNIALAGFQFAKGTLMPHDNVVISEGHLPQCASVRAVEHQRERTAALLLRQRAKGPASTGCGPNGCGPNGCGPNVVPNGATPTMEVPAMNNTTSLPAYLQTTPPLKEVPSLPASVTTNEPLPAPLTAKVEEVTTPLVPMTRTLPPATSAPAATAPAGARSPSDFGALRPEGSADRARPTVLPPGATGQ